jgi:hypothetical protein
MSYLYCDKHGREREAGIVEQQDAYRQAGEMVLVVSGTLATGPWQCDGCNATLGKGKRATLVSAFPSPCRHELYDYDFAYELGYFAMTRNDTATAYGAPWPDDSIRNRRKVSCTVKQAKPPLCALDFRRKT